MPSFLERMRASTIGSPWEALGIAAPIAPRGLDRDTLFRLRKDRNQRAELENLAMAQDIAARGGDIIRNRRLEKIAERPNVVYQPSLAEMQAPQREAIALAERELGAKERMGREELASREKIAGVESDIAQKKLAIDMWKAQNPEGEIVTDDQGNIHLVNKVTGQTIPTGLKSGDLSEKDKIKLTGEETRKTETLRQTGRMELEGARQAGREKLEGIKAQYDKGELPTQTKVAVENRARELFNTAPAYQKFIKVGSDGSIKIKKPGESGGPTPNEYNHMINYIFKGALSVQTPQLGSEALTPPGAVPITGSILEGTPADRAAALLKKYGGG